MFNLVSGIALLLASAMAGLLWDQLGPSAAFFAGMGFGALALAGVLWRAAIERRASKPQPVQG